MRTGAAACVTASANALRWRRSSPAGARAYYSMQIADDDLQRYEHRKQPDSHLLHDEALLDMTFAAQMVRGYADHDERGRDEERDRGVHQAVWEGRIEDDPIPVVRHEAAVDDRMAHRSLHPAVRGQDPERG